MMAWWESLSELARSTAVSTLWIIVVTVVLILSVAFTHAVGAQAHRLDAAAQGVRTACASFGFLPGMGQPFADVIKLLVKEIVVPSASNKVLFRIAPAITLIPAFAIWAVVPLAPGWCHRQRRCGPALRAVAHLGGRVWRDPRGLGLELQIRLPGRHALGGADRRV
jgi:NADH:ubiquinone oxidoreductase subunit H